MTREKSDTPREPFRLGQGSSQIATVGLVIMAISHGTIFFSGCSSSVNALSRERALDASIVDALFEGGQEAGGPPPVTIQSCPAKDGAPAGVGSLPTPSQAAYQRSELMAYIHLGLETFDGTEQGDSSKDVAALFNPTNVDATQWVNVFKDAGFRDVMLTAKHGTGFCLWPSAYTDFSVKNSPWKSGQGDVVKEFTDAMHLAGMGVGLYLSPWDQHYPSSNPNYETYFRNLLTELLTNYGAVNQIQFDGLYAPKSVDWAGIARLAKQLQPNILVWMGPEIATTGVDVRWIGNQSGQSSRSTSSIADVPNSGPTNAWYPAEAPVSVRMTNWFWHANESLMSLKSLQATYLDTVGMNATLRLNIPPSTTGQFDATDVGLLQDFGTWYASLFKTNLVKGLPVTADSTWAEPEFDAARVVDGDLCTYWAASSGKKSGRIDVTPATALTFSFISIREPIELGERTTSYHVELKQNGAWNKTPTDASGTQIQGTVIGQRQLWQLNPTTAEAVALVIDSAKDVPAIAEFGLY